MKKIITLFAIVTMSFIACAKEITKRLDSVADFYAVTFDFNGEVLVAKGGKILLHKSYGYQDKTRNIRNTNEGIYMIGSVTKQFTAEVILMLAAEGKLSVDDKLSKYFPELAWADSVTIRNMLNQTSGIFDYTQDPAWQTGKLDTPVSLNRLLSLIRNRRLKFAPGSKWNYSNSNYLLLGQIIEKTTGMSYYENVRTRIFNPLGMTTSGFDYTHLQNKHKTVGYYRVRNDSFLVAPIVDSTQTNAAGAIYSTTADMMKWHTALQGNKLLSREWQEKAYMPYKQHYGFGWENDTLCGKAILSHSGHIHGYNSNFYRLPEENVCIIVLTNLMKTGADPMSYAPNLVKAMYDSNYVIPAARREVKLAEHLQRRYQGIYTLMGDTTMLFKFTMNNGHLFLQVTGQPEVPLLPQNEALFFTKFADAQIEFRKVIGDDYHMFLYQNGEISEGKKIREL